MSEGQEKTGRIHTSVVVNRESVEEYRDTLEDGLRSKLAQTVTASTRDGRAYVVQVGQMQVVEPLESGSTDAFVMNRPVLVIEGSILLANREDAAPGERVWAGAFSRHIDHHFMSVMGEVPLREFIWSNQGVEAWLRIN